MAGQLTIAPFAAVTIDPNQDGDVNWAINPFGNPTWGQDFRSGGWIEDLVAAYLAGGPQAGAYQARAKQLAAGWLQALPPSGRDPQTLVCIAQAFPGQSWINDQIPPTVDYYAAHWMGAWNHGLMQDIKLLRIGCGYPPGAFGGDALRWRQTAVAQLTDAFEPNPLGPAIDAAGRGQRAGDAVRELRLHPVADRAARAGRLRLPAAGLDHGPDRAAARLPRVRHRARR